MLKSVQEDDKNCQIIFETQCNLESGINEIKLETVAELIGSFALNHVEIQMKNVNFILNFQQCIADSPNMENVYLSIDSRKPSVSLGNKPGLNV